VLAVDARARHHHLGLFIREVPFYSSSCGGALHGVQSRIHVRPVPTGKMFGIFYSPSGMNFVIMVPELFRALLELLGAPCSIVPSFLLESVMSLAPLLTSVIFLPFVSTFITRVTFTLFFIYKFF